MGVHPVQIIDIEMPTTAGGTSRMKLDKRKLQGIMDQVGDRKMVIISIAGAARQGKSFILNFFIRYLESLEETGLEQINEDWIGKNEDDKDLNGFEFKNGKERTTVGIWMWSKPFIVRNVNNEEFAIILMDSQGVFDAYTTLREWSAIVGVTLFTSSVFIYNLVHNIDENHLTVLQNFLEFGILAMKDDEDDVKAFQKLLFLVRDWNIPDDHDYGFDGGKEFIDDKLEIKRTTPKEAIHTRNIVKASFEKIECCLMPEPGVKAKANDYRGILSELEEEYVHYIKTCVEGVIDLENLEEKKIAGKLVTPNNLVKFVDRYVRLFNDVKAPTPVSMLDATAQASCESLLETQLDQHSEAFDKFFQQNPYCSRDEIKDFHVNMHRKLLEEFKNTKKIGSKAVHEKFLQKLYSELERSLAVNLSKNHETKHFHFKKLVNEVALNFEKGLIEVIGDHFVSQQILEDKIDRAKDIAIKLFFESGKNSEALSEFEPGLNKLLDEKANDIRAKNETLYEQTDLIATEHLYMFVKAYNDKMNEKFSQQKTYMNEDDLVKFHELIKKNIIQDFIKKTEIRDNDLRNTYIGSLDDGLTNNFCNYSSENESRKKEMELKYDKLIEDLVTEYKTCMNQQIEVNDINTDHVLLNFNYKTNAQIMVLFAKQNIIHDTELKDRYIESLKTQLGQEWKMILEKQDHIKVSQLNKFAQQNEEWRQIYRSDFDKALMAEKIPTDEELTNLSNQVKNKIMNEFNAPVFLSHEKKEEAKQSLSKSLEEDFKSRKFEHGEKIAEAQKNAEQLVSELLKNYQAEMDTKMEEMIETTDLKNIHNSVSQIYRSKFHATMIYCPKEYIVNYFESLESKFDESYTQNFDKLSSNLLKLANECDAALQECINQYKSKMSQHAPSKDPIVNKERHDLYKEKYGNELESKIKKNKVNPSEWQKKLNEELDKLLQESNVVVHEEIVDEVKEIPHENFDLNQIQNNMINEYSSIMGPIIGSLFDTKLLKDNHIKCRDGVFKKYRPSLEAIFSPNDFPPYLDKLSMLFDDQFQSLKQERKKITIKGRPLIPEKPISRGISNCTKRSNGNSKPFSNQINNKEITQTTTEQSALFADSSNNRNLPYSPLQQTEKSSRLANSLNSIPQYNFENPTENNHQKVHSAVLQKTIANASPDFGDILNNVHNEKAGIYQKSKTSFANFGAKIMGRLSYDKKESESDVIKATTNYEREMCNQLTISGYIHPDIIYDAHNHSKNVALSVFKNGLSNELLNNFERNIQQIEMKFVLENRSKISDNPVLGIDLGTNGCRVAVYVNDEAIMIPNHVGEIDTSSYLAVMNGHLITGHLAREFAEYHPTEVIYDVKRILGRQYDDPVLQNHLINWPFQVINNQVHPIIRVGGKSFYPEKLFAAIFANFQTTTQNYFGHKTIQDAVITVPSTFSDSQRESIKHAGQVAGLNVLGLINESAAVALACGINSQPQGRRKKTVLVYDLGAGKLDVSIFSVENEQFEVLAVGGDTDLGGRDFDNALVNYCLTEFANNNPSIEAMKVDPSSKIVDYLRDSSSLNVRYRKLLDECEKQKIELSNASSTTIHVESFCANIDLSVEITRAEFEIIIEPLVQKSLEITHKTLELAGMKVSDVNQVILSGRSSKVPKINQSLAELFKGRHIIREDFTENFAAKGAGIFGASLNKHFVSKLGGVQIKNKTPFSIGVEQQAGTYLNIIQKNSPIPLSKEVTLTTSSGKQKVLTVRVYEGDGSSSAENRMLGKFELSDLPTGQNPQKINATFCIDSFGIFFLKVDSVNNKGKQIKVLTFKKRLSDETIQKLKSNK